MLLGVEEGNSHDLPRNSERFPTFHTSLAEHEKFRYEDYCHVPFTYGETY